MRLAISSASSSDCGSTSRIVSSLLIERSPRRRFSPGLAPAGHLPGLAYPAKSPASLASPFSNSFSSTGVFGPIHSIVVVCSRIDCPSHGGSSISILILCLSSPLSSSAGRSRPSASRSSDVDPRLFASIRWVLGHSSSSSGVFAPLPTSRGVSSRPAERTLYASLLPLAVVASVVVALLAQSLLLA